MAADSKLGLPRSCFLTALVIALLFVAMELLCQPYGNFPLNDDWSYARVVKTLIDEHRLTVTPWTLSASISPVLLGALVCKVFAFSFESLRGLTLCLNLLMLSATGYLLRELEAPPALVFFALLSLLVNPLIFCLSNTFMTDVPALSFLLLSSCFYLRYFKKPGAGDLIMAVLMSCLLCLTRQVLIVAPLSFFLAVALAKLRGRFAGRLLPAALPLAAAAACVFVHHQWLLHVVGLPFCYRVEQELINRQLSQGVVQVVLQALQKSFVALIYLGLFLLPLLVGGLPAFLAGRSMRGRFFSLILAAEVAVLLSAGLLFRHALMPLADNVLYDLGLGPVLLPGLMTPAAPPAFWISVTLASCCGAGLLVAYQVPAGRLLRADDGSGPARPPAAELICLFAWSFIILYLLAICLRGFFDRYLISLMPFFIFLIAESIQRYGSESLNKGIENKTAGGFTRQPASLVCACLGLLMGVAFCLFSVLGVHDYFALNRARFQAWKYLTVERRINPSDINAGLELNGWSSSDPSSGETVVTSNTDLARGDNYLISTGEMQGYRLLNRFAFPSWLFGSTHHICALKKNEP